MTIDSFLEKAQPLIKKYHPSQEALQRVKDVELLIVVGPSGVGKSALIEASKFHLVPSDTTRTKRPGEVDGQDMYFRKDYQEILNQLSSGDFVQVAIGPSGDFYATRPQAYLAVGFVAMPIVADVVPVSRALGFKKTVTVFVVPPSYDEWMRRMGTRPLSEGQISMRLEEAKRSFRFALVDEETHFILNDDLDDAVEQTKGVLAGVANNQRERQAKDIAGKIYEQLLGL